MHILISATIPVRYDEQLFSRGKGPSHRIIESYDEDNVPGGGGGGGGGGRPQGGVGG